MPEGNRSSDLVVLVRQSVRRRQRHLRLRALLRLQVDRQLGETPRGETRSQHPGTTPAMHQLVSALGPGK